MKSDLMQIILGGLVVLAAAFSIGSVSWCETVDFTLRGLRNRQVSFGLWRYNSFVLVGSSTGDLWKVETCNAYPEDTEQDGYWRAAQAFSIIAPIWGVLAWCPMTSAGRNPRMAKVSGVLLLLACLFQGLTLLIMNSNLCDAYENPYFDEYPTLQAEGALTTSDRCHLGRSGIISIVSTCLWFVAGAIALLVPVEPGSEDEK